MFLKLLKKLGFFWATILLSTAAILLSVIITYLATSLTGNGPSKVGLIIAILIPGILTLVFSLLIVSLVFQLDTAKEKLVKLSITDDLTSVFNRRHFIELLEKEWLRTKRYGDEFAVIIFDIDEFKDINDSFGHAAGDLVLQIISQTCKQAIRSTDTFARYGGDEFVFLIPQSKEIDLLAFMERVRLKTAETSIFFKEQEIRVTLSMGGKRFHNGSVEFANILIQADEALYQAKNQGGDICVIVKN